MSPGGGCVVAPATLPTMSALKRLSRRQQTHALPAQRFSLSIQQSAVKMNELDPEQILHLSIL